jgi:hypothetical protein
MKTHRGGDSHRKGRLRPSRHDVAIVSRENSEGSCDDVHLMTSTGISLSEPPISDQAALQGKGPRYLKHEVAGAHGVSVPSSADAARTSSTSESSRFFIGCSATTRGRVPSMPAPSTSPRAPLDPVGIHAPRLSPSARPRSSAEASSPGCRVLVADRRTGRTS